MCWLSLERCDDDDVGFCVRVVSEDPPFTSTPLLLKVYLGVMSDTDSPISVSSFYFILYCQCNGFVPG